MKSWYTIRARASGAEVLIYDEIGAYGVTAKGFLAELGALPDDASIDLRLNSPGGSVFDAVAIYNALQRHEGTITVWIDAIAASAASYIAMAGDEIVMPENAFLMIHDPSGLVMGTAADMREMADTMDKIAGSMIRGYAGRSGRSEDEIAALMTAETWFDAQDALAAGFATRMAEPVRIAASFDIGRFRNAPPSRKPLAPPTVLRTIQISRRRQRRLWCPKVMLGKTTSPQATPPRQQRIHRRQLGRSRVFPTGTPAHRARTRAVLQPPTLLRRPAPFAPRPSRTPVP